MMITIDDRRPKDSSPPPDLLKDPWADWKPAWTGKKQTPQDIQERHSPTEAVKIRDTSTRKTSQHQRRIVDARLWDAMAPTQQDAAEMIATSFEMMGAGMGYVSSNWQRIPGCRGTSNVSEAHAQMIRAYLDWSKKCAAAKISHAMVVDVLCFGFSCRAVDRDRRLRSGSARDNLMQGLSLYAELRGWRV